MFFNAEWFDSDSPIHPWPVSPSIMKTVKHWTVEVVRTGVSVVAEPSLDPPSAVVVVIVDVVGSVVDVPCPNHVVSVMLVV